jgi:potassium-transporting ATPase potassium-binding subunit
MTANGLLQIVLYLAVLTLLVKPLGWYMARVYRGKPTILDPLCGPAERIIYRCGGVDPEKEMSWRTYAQAMLWFNLLGLLIVYLLQRIQRLLPLNPEALPSISPDSAFNTAASFATNTNWQGYGGETTMSYLTQMAGLTVQNFVSAAAGMAVLVALIRGFSRQKSETIGNFWYDLTRSTVYILLPLSVAGALFLVSQGVVQTFHLYQKAALVQPLADGNGNTITEQTIAVGPAASQVMIKQLGTNGGGFFNVNSAHPLENPTPLSNFVEMLSILLISAALCYTFGIMVRDVRQGWAILAAMFIIFIPSLLFCFWAEQSGNPAFVRLGIDQQASVAQPGGNMEGKETRIGIVSSAIWATATTAASNGSVNSMHDSFTPLGGLVPMWMMQLGEVIFGGVGSGLYGMIVFAIIAVFIAGLMVGRTPEYLGKKIEAFEMKMAALVILIPPLVVLVGTAISVVVSGGKAGILNPGAHGFSEVLYAFSSAGNNNGSAFAGLSANTVFYNTILGITMLIARYWLALPTLAIAGSLARKKSVPTGVGTLPTHTPLFISLLVGVVLLVGALTFLPALALGPVVEHLMMVE